MGSLERRLRVLEDQTPAPESSGVSETRAKMKFHLDQIVRYRRGELGPEEAAEVEAFTKAFERERARRRGEGRSY